MITVIKNMKNTFFHQYRWGIIEVDKSFDDASSLKDFLCLHHPDEFDSFIDYRLFKVARMEDIPWSWSYKKVKQKLKEAPPDEPLRDCIVYFDYDHSQWNEDFIISSIFNKIEPDKHFVDIGSKDGRFISNTYALTMQGWQGLLADPTANESHSNGSLVFKKLAISPSNFEETMKDSSVPQNFDFLNVDIDGNDIHIVSSLKDYRPKVICVEANASDGKYKINYSTDYKVHPKGRQQVGRQATILALNQVLEDKGYFLIYNNGGNCFFIDNKYRSKFQELDIEKYILEQLSIILKDESLFGKSTSAKNAFLDYAKGNWESHYPYILKYDIS